MRRETFFLFIRYFGRWCSPSSVVSVEAAILLLGEVGSGTPYLRISQLHFFCPERRAFCYVATQQLLRRDGFFAASRRSNFFLARAIVEPREGKC